MEITNPYKGFKFVKELKSDTKARASHIKIDGENYQVVVCYVQRLNWFIFGHQATRTGLISKDSKRVYFKLDAKASNIANKAHDDDMQTGINEMVRIVSEENEAKKLASIEIENPTL